ncbi:hypothetical protein AgCh_025819 [Apium graveolens]
MDLDKRGEDGPKDWGGWLRAPPSRGDKGKIVMHESRVTGNTGKAKVVFSEERMVIYQNKIFKPNEAGKELDKEEDIGLNLEGVSRENTDKKGEHPHPTSLLSGFREAIEDCNLEELDLNEVSIPGNRVKASQIGSGKNLTEHSH